MVNVADLQSLNVIWVGKYYFLQHISILRVPILFQSSETLTAVLPFQSHAGGEEKLKLGQTGFKMTPQ